MIIMTKYKIKINSLYKYIPILLLINILLSEYSVVIGKAIIAKYTRNFILYGLPYFLMGHLINEKDISNKISNKDIGFTIISSILLIILERLSTGKFDMYIGTIFLSLAIFIWCIKNPKALNFNFMAWMGKNISSYIYVLHVAIMWIVEVIETNYGIPQVLNVYYTNTIVVFVLTALLSMIIYFINKGLRNRKFLLIKNE